MVVGLRSEDVGKLRDVSEVKLPVSGNETESEAVGR